MTGGNSTFASSGGKGIFIPFQGLFQNRALWTRFFICSRIGGKRMTSSKEEERKNA